MVDKYAPIIPYKEMGNIKLYSSMAELSDVISISKEYIPVSYTHLRAHET